jgi:hypothetical protein
MKQGAISLFEAFIKKLPEMSTNKYALPAIAEMLDESLYSGNFNDHYIVVDQLTGEVGNYEIPINILEFHGIFWISAIEIGYDGFFTSKEDAISFAEDRYSAFREEK